MERKERTDEWSCASSPELSSALLSSSKPCNRRKFVRRGGEVRWPSDRALALSIRQPHRWEPLSEETEKAPLPHSNTRTHPNPSEPLFPDPPDRSHLLTEPPHFLLSIIVTLPTPPAAFPATPHAPNLPLPQPPVLLLQPLDQNLLVHLLVETHVVLDLSHALSEPVRVMELRWSECGRGCVEEHMGLGEWREDTEGRDQ